VVSNGVVPIGTIMGERLIYLPSVGFCLAAALALRRGADLLPFTGPRRCVLFACVVALVCAAHAGRAVVRNADWRSNETLFLADLEGARSSKRLSNGGSILIDQGIDVERGVALLERAVAMQPGQYDYLDNLGWCYYKLGDYERARTVLRRSLALEPGGPTAEDRRTHLRQIEEALRGYEGRSR
jgi:tetratricopeptide (TPR) repeat protein